MNEKFKNFWKKIGGYIVAFLVGVGATLVAILWRNRGATDKVGEGISDAKGTSDRIEDTLGDIGREVSGIRDAEQQLEESTDRLGEIIEEIRNQRVGG